MSAARKMSTLVRRVSAAAALPLATVARATGDSGTEAMGEMTITAGQFMAMGGGLAGLGVVIWLVVKAMNR